MHCKFLVASALVVTGALALPQIIVVSEDSCWDVELKHMERDCPYGAPPQLQCPQGWVAVNRDTTATAPCWTCCRTDRHTVVDTPANGPEIAPATPSTAPNSNGQLGTPGMPGMGQGGNTAGSGNTGNALPAPALAPVPAPVPTVVSNPADQAGPVPAPAAPEAPAGSLAADNSPAPAPAVAPFRSG